MGHEKKTILITGINGTIGKSLRAQLEKNFHLLGLDSRPGPPHSTFAHSSQTEIYSYDLRKKSCEKIFKQHPIDCVVHLNLIRDPRVSCETRHTFNIQGTNQLLKYCAQYNVKKFIFLSTAQVYGPRPENPQFISEEAPLLASGHYNALNDQVEADMLVGQYFWKAPKMEIVILRPAPIIGGPYNSAQHYLDLERPITLLGHDVMVQFTHLEDLVQVLTLSVKHPLRGIYNLSSRDQISLKRLLKELGKKSRPMLEPLAQSLIKLMWDLHLTHFPVQELHFLKYPCMVNYQKILQELPYIPQWSIGKIIEEWKKPTPASYSAELNPIIK